MAQSAYQRVYGLRGIEPESLVRHQVDVGAMRHEVTGYILNGGVGAYQYGYLAGCRSLCHEHVDGLGDALHHLCLIVFCGHQFDVYQPAVFLPLGFLAYILVSA